MKPAQAVRGAQGIEAKIIGTNFTGIVAVNMGDGIVLQDTELVSPTKISVKFSVKADAAPGPRKVTVMTSGGSVQSLTAFSIAENASPHASFNVTPTEAGKNTPFSVDASASSDSDGSVSQYAWDFGDGATAGGVTAKHSYASAGTFTITLTVTDNGSATGTATKQVVVTNNQSPRAHFNFSPRSGNVKTVFTFDGGDSNDPDGRVASWSWNFDDGQTVQGKKVTHIFHAKGTYNVTLTVKDNGGLEGEVSKDIQIAGVPPEAHFTVTPDSGTKSTTFHFDAGDSNDKDGRIVSYIFNFDDGVQVDAKRIDHKFSSNGDYNVKLTVTDNDQNTDSAEKTIHVGDDTGPPPPPPPPGGGCTPTVTESSGCSGYSNAQYFTVSQVLTPGPNPTVFISSENLHLCKGHICEVRRLGVSGYAEFLGDLKDLDCSNKLTLSQIPPVSTHYIPPENGDKALLVCK